MHSDDFRITRKTPGTPPRGLDRDDGKNLKAGVGYNFTDFSDELTDLRYNHKGVFVNLIGTK